MLFGVLVLTFVIAMVNGEMTGEAKAQLLKLHNEHRADLGASNMFKLQWDDELQKAAEEWNNRCVYKHQGRGENLAWNKPAEPLPVKELIDIAFTDWYNEKKLHSYGSGQCSRYGSCHYTQLAWHDTTKLGCSYRTCSNLANAAAGAWWIVCLYKPWGNNGGEKVFETGKACSHPDCKGLPCENKLCVGEKKRECKDGNENCPEWKKNGQCEGNPDYMKKTCPLSCGVCKVEEKNESASKPTNDCEDDSTECKKWADSGECTKNPSYMLKSCKKSCNGCQLEENESASKPTNDCEDDRTECKRWAERGECARNPRYMLKSCKKSCNRCQSGNAGSTSTYYCRDENYSCAMWQRWGECYRNPGYMLIRCKKSCGRCHCKFYKFCNS